jgi:signal transduction histidine kinase
VALPVGTAAVEHFAWQLVAADGRVLRRSQRAPGQAWHATPRTGFANVTGWRVYGLPAGRDGRVLYAAQTRAERNEARAEVALGAVLAALAVGLLGQLWLRARVRQELQPLQRLSQRLGAWQAPQGAAAALGAPERAELIPVHVALEDLAARLATRLASEQAFSAHAAHALRTPLAGIDAQLAVAARTAPPELAERLVRVRGAAARLQHVVAALLGLFRSADGTAALQRGPVRLDELVQRLPPFALALQAEPGATLDADADLLAAALLNLLDNAQRHGARTVHLAVAEGGRVLRLRDDGRGIEPARRAALAQALAEERYADTGGLGLMLADRVARAHGGRLRLPAVDAGFGADLELGPR